jgi:hypothetical protein
VGCNPAGGFEHLQSTVDEVRGRHGLNQRRQRGAQAFGLPAKAANPELAPLVGHHGLCRFPGGAECLAMKQTGEEKQRDHHNAGP